MAPVDGRGALFNIITWITLVAMCLATLIKVGTKLVKARRLQQDDYYFLAAMAIYTAEVLYVPALGLSRLAVLQFLTLIAPSASRKMVVKMITSFNFLWILVVVLSLAFQCRVPQTWAVYGDTCFNQTAFWNAFGGIELAMDLIVSLVPVYLVLSIQMQGAKKISVMIAFAARMLTAPFIIARLFLINQNSRSQDRPYDDLYIALLMELHIMFAVVISCAPFMKIVMQSLQPGWLVGDFRSYPPTASGYPSAMKGDKSSRRDDPTPHDISGSQGWTELCDRRQADTVITTGKTLSSESTEQDEAVEKGLVIKQTKTIAINYQE